MANVVGRPIAALVLFSEPQRHVTKSNSGYETEQIAIDLCAEAGLPFLEERQIF